MAFLVRSRVVTDTDLAGYPENNFAGYRISGEMVNIELFFKIENILVFIKTYQHFWSLFKSYFILSEKVLKKVCSSVQQFYRISVYPVSK